VRVRAGGKMTSGASRIAATWTGSVPPGSGHLREAVAAE
jgi:hypothetical protein